jgi:hypothetical protein
MYEDRLGSSPDLYPALKHVVRDSKNHSRLWGFCHIQGLPSGKGEWRNARLKSSRDMITWQAAPPPRATCPNCLPLEPSQQNIALNHLNLDPTDINRTF